jgi:hypothetical protein
MKDDQFIRGALGVAAVGMYLGHIALNGSGSLAIPGVGEVHPFLLTLAAVVILAVPEILNKIPFGRSSR